MAAAPPGSGLSPLEAAWAIPMGPDPATGPLPSHPPRPPRAALEDAVLGAVRRPPCLVSFSGGRDSSAVLALATLVARREGLPDPIPATNRFAAVPASDERDWQELVVGHLGLRDWIRLELGDELDMVGPVSASLLRRHGVLAPFNTHFHVPLLERAAGGSLLTGIGGDELFEPTERGVLARLLYARRLPRRRQLGALAGDVLPRALRARRLAGDAAYADYHWIRPAARARLARLNAAWSAREPISYRAAITDWWWRSRILQVNLAAKRLVAADHDVAIGHPFAEPAVLAAYGAARGPAGPPGRTWALRELFGDLLPAELIERESKSSFDGAFWTETARAFAAGWTGRGVDPELVDPEALAREWRAERPDAHTFTLLQQAFLAEQAE